MKRSLLHQKGNVNRQLYHSVIQDAAALELIRRRGALKDVDAGRISAAIAKCAPIWASMPGAGYAQPERKLNTLLASYSAAGGNLEA